MLREGDSRGLRPECPTPELDDCRHTTGERLHRRALLELAEGVLATVGEELGDRGSGSLLDDGIDGDERAAEKLCERRPQGRLPSAHEPDEREVTVESVQRSRGHRIRSRYAR